MPYQRVLVPIDGSPGDEHALRVALGLLRRGRATVYLTYVVEVPQTLPLDAALPAEEARGEAAIQRCEALCGGERMPVEAVLLQARSAGAAIVDEAAQRAAEVIVMSVEGRHHRGEFTLGHTAPYVLKNAACEVCVLRRPLGGA